MVPNRPLQWRHNDHDGASNHQPHGCLPNRLFRRRSKKTSKLRVTGLCVGNSPGPVTSQHKGPVTWKMFSFDDVIMRQAISLTTDEPAHYRILRHRTSMRLTKVRNSSFFHRHEWCFVIWTHKWISASNISNISVVSYHWSITYYGG